MAVQRSESNERPKSAVRQLAEFVWDLRLVRELVTQASMELKSMPQSISHELVTRGWFGREIKGDEPKFSGIHGKAVEQKKENGVHGPSLNETGIHGRGDMQVEDALGLYGYDDQSSPDIYGLDREERLTIGETRSILEGFGNERAVAQLDRAFLQDIGIIDRDTVDWSDFDQKVEDRAPERAPSREQEMERG